MDKNLTNLANKSSEAATIKFQSNSAEIYEYSANIFAAKNSSFVTPDDCQSTSSRPDVMEKSRFGHWTTRSASSLGTTVTQRPMTSTARKLWQVSLSAQPVVRNWLWPGKTVSRCTTEALPGSRCAT